MMVMMIIINYRGSDPKYENVAQSLPVSLGILGMQNGIQERQKSPSVATKVRTENKCVDGFKVRCYDYVVQSVFAFNDHYHLYIHISIAY